MGNLRNSVIAYNKSRQLFMSLRDLFAELESVSDDVIKSRLLKNITHALRELARESKKINLDALAEKYSGEDLNIIKKNKEAFRIQGDYLRRKVMGIVYYDDIMPNINSYIRGVISELTPAEEATYGDDPVKLRNIFLTKILHPDNVDKFKLKLDQLVQATLSQSMFNKIFKGIMYSASIAPEKLSREEFGKNYGHPEAQKRAAQEFQSFAAYKAAQEKKKAEAEQKAHVKFRKKEQ